MKYLLLGLVMLIMLIDHVRERFFPAFVRIAGDVRYCILYLGGE